MGVASYVKERNFLLLNRENPPVGLREKNLAYEIFAVPLHHQKKTAVRWTSELTSPSIGLPKTTATQQRNGKEYSDVFLALFVCEQHFTYCTNYKPLYIRYRAKTKVNVVKGNNLFAVLSSQRCCFIVFSRKSPYLCSRKNKTNIAIK